MRRVILAAAVVSALGLASACTHVGIAKLPQKSDFFITTGDVDWEYEPIALMEIVDQQFACAADLESMYANIEQTLKEELSIQAKNMGADGLINLHYNVMVFPPIATVRVQGIAIKRQ